jgi:hypothetical protein
VVCECKLSEQPHRPTSWDGKLDSVVYRSLMARNVSFCSKTCLVAKVSADKDGLGGAEACFRQCMRILKSIIWSATPFNTPIDECEENR